MRVLILYNKLFHYRIPVWNLLAEKCDLTVAYSQGDEMRPKGIECNFKTLYLPAWSFKGRFFIQKENIRKIAKQYDAVIAYGDISWLKYSTLPWFNKTKVIFHTIGVSASYNKGYDSHREWDRVRKFFFSKADALLFYTSYPIEKYAKMGIAREKMFVAPNTVEVRPIKYIVEKDSILFIGTLYKQKGLQALLDAYLLCKGQNELPKLRIIGSGPDEETVKKWISQNNMDDLVEMKGAIYNIDQKAEFFAKAYACISPRQAGLSVLESMGYGVPFITTRQAITGGEVFNIHSGVDGLVIDDESELAGIIKEISDNKSKYIEMGKNAKSYYNNNRTPSHMADGMWEAIKYVLQK